jgi:AcrR family transcriptional regulator
MVQKNKSSQPSRVRRPRGRPRAYDPDLALRKALKAFWTAGYSATSLDDLAKATGMNRPSLYAAFGDKQSLYLKTLDYYWELSAAAMRDALPADRPLAEALMRVYETALSFYYPRDGRPRGCFAIGTATSEAVTDARIRAALDDGLRMLDAAFELRIRQACEQGELPRNADTAALAILASATLHTIAIRARAGASQAELMRLARRAVSVICGR